MKRMFKVKQKCQSCKGTGIYVGMAERDQVGVVCYRCKGTGAYVFVHEYEDFVKREDREDVVHVVETNPGICIGNGNKEPNKYQREYFGGMPYLDWREGKPFPMKSEMRAFTCPSWWNQSAGKDKPEWDECGIGLFSACKHFKNKDKCWERFDNEKK